MYFNFQIAINSEGEIQYLKNTFYENAGINYNEVLTPISLMHFQNCYESKRWYIQANNVITDCASNTWCRAPCEYNIIEIFNKKYIL